jgi:hypothetical protein
LRTDPDGVPGVVAARVTDDDIRLLGEHVNDLAFAFVAPLGANENRVCHGAARADFDPIPLTPGSFTHDMIVERTAPPPLNTRVSATMDGGTNNNAWTWFEQGWLAGAPTTGLPPQGSTFAAFNDPNRTFRMAANYAANNVLLVYSNQSAGATIGLPSGTLLYTTPTASSTLSVLCAGGGVVASLAYTITYQGGATESGTVAVNDWMNTSALEVAWNANGRVNMDSGETGSLFATTPKLFYVDIYPANGGTPIASISFNSTNANRAAIFAVSGTTDGFTYTPIGVTGYNRDMIVEQSAPVAGSLASRLSVTMDGGSPNISGNAWYEQGFNPNAPTTGLPAPGGTISDASRTFIMPSSYAGNNALFIGNFRTYTSGTLTLNTPAAYSGLSFLTASGNGPLVMNVTVRYSDSSTEAFTISSPDWFNQPNTIFTAAGRVQAQNMQLNDVNSTNPRLSATNITLNSASPVTAIDFTYASGGRGPIFAVSGQTTLGGNFSPVAVSGFNADIIVEASPAWPPYGIQSYTTASMDGGVANTGNSWNERGYYPQFPNCGLPAPGTIITSLAKDDHHYQMPANYAGNNAAFVDSVRSNVNLTLASPAPYSALSFLSATANNNVTNQAIIQFQDGTSETNTFVSRDWFNNSPFAYTARGRVNLVNRHMNSAQTDNPRLYEAEFALANNTSPVTNINLRFLGAINPTTGRMAVLAVSATAGAVRPIISAMPPSFRALEGSNVTIAATIGGGTAPITYQWYVGTNGVYVPVSDGGTITGADTPSLAFTPIGWTNTAAYYLVASNVAGFTTGAVTTATILSGLPSVTVPGDLITAVPNIPPAPAAEPVTMAIDRTTSKWLGYGSDGNNAAPFTGPQAFIVTPALGKTIVSVLRFYTANDTEGRDPADYTLEGSNNGGQTWTPIAGSALALPAARNAAALPLDPLTQNLQEVRFANSAAYLSYRWTVNNVKDNAGVHSLQIAEIELLGLPSPEPPSITRQPTPAGPIWVGGSPNFSVTAVGAPPLTYQWYVNGTTLIPGATSASYTFPDAQLADSGKTFHCVVSNIYGGTPSASAALSVIAAPTGNYIQTIVQSRPMAMYRLDEGPDDFLGNNGVVAVDHMGGFNGVYSNTILGVAGYSVNDADPAASFGNYAASDSYVGNIQGLSFAAPTNESRAFTVEAWVNAGLGPQSVDAGIVTLGYGGGGEQFNLDFGGNGAAHNVRWMVREAGGGARAAITTNAITDGKWHHIVGVCDPINSNIVALYIDGQLQASTPMPAGSGIYPATRPVSIGSRPQNAGTSYDFQFVGQLDEVAIYDYALTPQQILSHFYAAGIVPFVTLQPTNQVGGGLGVAEGSPVTFHAAASGTPVLGYQWYLSDGFQPTSPLPGQTSSNLFFPAISIAQSFQNYQLVITNVYGAATSSPAYAYVVSGPPVASTDLPAQLLGCAGATLSMSVQFAGTAPFTYRWQRNGVNLTDNGHYQGTQTATLTIPYPTVADNGTYQLWATNVHGVGSSSPGTLTVLPVPTVANGSFNSGLGFSLNGGAVIAGTELTLTDGGASQSRSSFFQFPLYIGAFKASFTYQDVGGGGADGAAFVLHNDPRGVAALGGGGGSLAYGPTPAIIPSAAVLLNIYAANTVGYAVRTNGVTGVPYVTPGTVNLAGGNPIAVSLDYDGANLGLTFTDTVTAATYSTNLPVGDLTGPAGGETAYVGFTGATGGTVATQKVTDFSYTAVPKLGLVLQGNQAVLSWPMNVGGYTLATKPDLATGTWQAVNAPIVVVGDRAQVSVPLGAGNHFYRLVLP